MSTVHLRDCPWRYFNRRPHPRVVLPCSDIDIDRKACYAETEEKRKSAPVGPFEARRDRRLVPCVEEHSDMIHRAHRTAFFVAAVLVPGCSLAGTWRATDHEPGAKHIAIEVMTFDGDRFTATSDVDGERLSTAGQYQLKGGRLTLRPSRGREQSYRCRRTLGGRLELSHRGHERPTWQTFRKVDEKRP